MLSGSARRSYPKEKFGLGSHRPCNGLLLRSGGGLAISKQQPLDRRILHVHRPAVGPPDEPLLLKNLKIPANRAPGDT